MLRNAGSLAMGAARQFAEPGKLRLNKSSSTPVLSRTGPLGGITPSPSAYQASPHFAGARPGFVYKLDKFGLGYYADAVQARRDEAAARLPALTPAIAEPGAAQSADFVPSDHFAGHRKGYAFKLAHKGQGYYSDSYEPRAQRRSRCE